MSAPHTDARMVHFLIKRTAQELAGAYYDLRAHQSDMFYKLYPSERQFVAFEWQKFVLVAKQVLTECLTKNRLNDIEKTDIYEALIADATLPYSPQEVQVVNVPH